MSIEEAILEKLRELPPDKQREVLDFAEFLKSRILPKRPRRSMKGLWADLGFSVSEKDIADVRREMWKNFARDDIL